MALPRIKINTLPKVINAHQLDHDQINYPIKSVTSSDPDGSCLCLGPGKHKPCYNLAEAILSSSVYAVH